MLKKVFLSFLLLMTGAAVLLTSCVTGGGEAEATDTESRPAPAESATEPDTEPETEASVPVPTGTKGRNPIISTLFTADPSAHVFGDTLYIYASHDVFPSRGCDLMDKYHVFSTTNMVDFADEGEILSSKDLSWGAEGFMWAPDCVEKDGKYYFYFPHPESTENWNSTWRCGVAVSDSPTGGFVDKGMLENVDGSLVGEPDGTGHDYSSMIDPCVFKDTDGTYFLFIGGGSHLYYAPLASDMLSLDEPLREVPAEQCPDYHEGSWVFRRGDIYYLIYADNSSGGNCMR
ncbi:MAG: family 43 glycosylhydrolase, partial [Clostridia bacterium]|nr:family 43 glycosylhydrolase [Clostridia bacterium]